MKALTIFNDYISLKQVIGYMCTTKLEQQAKLRGVNRPNNQGQTHGLQFTTQHTLSITFSATVTYLPGILHHLSSSIQDIFGLTLLCCAHLNRKGGAAVLRGKFLSSKSGILWICGAFKTTGGRIYNYDLDDHSKHIFPSRSLFIPDFPVVLNSLKSSFRSSELRVVLSTAQIMLH